MFQEELAFFIAHQDDLVKKYRGQVLVIKGQQLIGVYKTPLEAYLQAQMQFPLGTFMLQRCEPGSDAYTVTLNSHTFASGPHAAN